MFYFVVVVHVCNVLIFLTGLGIDTI
jgi:hypothetical protein